MKPLARNSLGMLVRGSEENGCTKANGFPKDCRSAQPTDMMMNLQAFAILYELNHQTKYNKSEFNGNIKMRANFE